MQLDGSPKLDDKINLKKVEVNTSPAAMSSVQYELSVSSIAKIDMMVTVRADGNYENETFLFNYINGSRIRRYFGGQDCRSEGSYGRIYRMPE